jgi:hypothetical protein
MHSAVSRNRLKSFALNLLVSWAGWTPANHRRNPVIIKATAIARFSARHSEARNLVVEIALALADNYLSLGRLASVITWPFS